MIREGAWGVLGKLLRVAPFVAAVALLSSSCGSTKREFDESAAGSVAGSSSESGADTGGRAGAGATAGTGARAGNAGTGGNGGDAGAADAGAGPGGCEPGEREDCWDASLGAQPPAAQLKGDCHLGSRVCGLDRTWGSCAGSVAPQAADTCDAGNDASCNGTPNEGCTCVAGSKRPCGKTVGKCKAGEQACENAAWGTCVGEVKPAAADTCEAGDDSTCDGIANSGCTCIDGKKRPCGTTLGNCTQGEETCAGGAWGACVGGIQKQAADTCVDGDDADCDGVPNEGCTCKAAQVQACGKCGTRVCAQNGTYNACSGEGECAAGTIETRTQNCGNCGTQAQQRTCSPTCGWGTWTNSGVCTGQGECAPNEIKNLTPSLCSYCGEQARRQTCSTSCQFGAVTNVGSCVQKSCPGLPGDERTGYVKCNQSQTLVCGPTAPCCNKYGGNECTATACTGIDDFRSECDGPEDCTGGKRCYAYYGVAGYVVGVCDTQAFDRPVYCHNSGDCPTGTGSCWTVDINDPVYGTCKI